MRRVSLKDIARLTLISGGLFTAMGFSVDRQTGFAILTLTLAVLIGIGALVFVTTLIRSILSWIFGR